MVHFLGFCSVTDAVCAKSIILYDFLFALLQSETTFARKLFIVVFDVPAPLTGVYCGELYLQRPQSKLCHDSG